MRVYVESFWACDPEFVWRTVQQSALLTHVAWPLVTLRPVGEPAFPEQWRENSLVKCRSRLLGILPLGTRHLFFERIDDGRREIQTRESDPLVSRWDHQIRVEPAGLGRTRYIDSVEIEAGRLTWLVWLFALIFYRHRQHRWRDIAEAA